MRENCDLRDKMNNMQIEIKENDMLKKEKNVLEMKLDILKNENENFAHTI